MEFAKEDMWRKLAGETGNFYAEANNEERTQYRDWLKVLLESTRLTVVFTKADGTDRTMVCTLSEQEGAKYSITESTNKRKPNEDVCVVWDCEINNWRSFRWDRIKGVKFNLV